jgi:Pvc16 N-terminal domain
VAFEEAMSSYKGIRAVSSTLKNLLTAEMENPVGVTLLPPDVAPTSVAGKRINLYLYLVSENGNLKNQEIPGQGHPGSFGFPPLSLNLHYLMTSHADSDTSDDRDLTAQEILGDGMRVLHDFAIITRDSSFAVPELRNEFESIKIALQPASLEEFAKIWTALPNANFRCSVAYNVTVIQIESERPRRLALPVQTRRLHMSLAKRPEIVSVYRTPFLPGDPIGDARAAVGQSLTITGAGFKAAKTWVKLGALEPIGVMPTSDEMIQIAVPDAEYPADFDHPLPPRPIPSGAMLQPGPQLVQVVTQRPGEGVQGGLDRGGTFVEAVVQASSQSVFMLVPGITSINPGAGISATTLSVNGTRLFNSAFKSYVYVADVAIEVPQGPPATDTQVQVALAALTKTVPPLPPSPTPYPVRVQVNGVLSIEEKPFTYSWV